MNEDASEPVGHGGCAPDAGLHCIGATLRGVQASLALKGAHLQRDTCIASASMHPSRNSLVPLQTMTAVLPVSDAPFLMAVKTDTQDWEKESGHCLSAHLAAMAAAHSAAPLVGDATHCFACLWLDPAAG